MLKLVTIDLSTADVALFEAYEARVLRRLEIYGARLELRLRTTTNSGEVHLVHFPDEPSYEAFLSDPVRLKSQSLWENSGASAESLEVEEISIL